MLRYKLASLANRRAGTSAVLPPVEPSLSAEAAFLRAERTLLRGMLGWAREYLVPAYQRDLERAPDGITRDVDEWTWGEFDGFTARLVAVAVNLVRRVLDLEGARNTKGFMASAKRTLGVDLNAVVRDDDIADYLDQASARAANLITGMADDLRKRIKDRTITAVLQGETSTAYRKTLATEFGLSDSRAKLIARDQIGKVTSDLNRIRQQQAGIVEYDWMTAADERVRPLHRALNGKRYKYGEPTGAEGGLGPGQPIRCRCIARAVVEF